MLKLLKRASLLLLALCLAVGIGVTAAACKPKEPTPEHTQHVDNNNDGKCDECGKEMPGKTPETENVTYEITVTLEDNPALLLTITVELYDSGNKLAASKQLQRNDNGKVSFTLAEGTYTVKLSGLNEESYTYTAGTVSKASPKCTIAVTPKEQGPGGDDPVDPNAIEYRIKVLIHGAEGEADIPVEGARVQVCIGAMCKAPVETGADGVATIMLTPDVWSIHILGGLPAGYFFDNEAYTTTAEGGDFVVYLTEGQEYTISVLDAAHDNAPMENITVGIFAQYNDENGAEQYETEPFATEMTGADGVAKLVGKKDVVYRVDIINPEDSWNYENTLLVEASAPSTTLYITERGTDMYDRIVVSEGTYTVSLDAGMGLEGKWYEFHPAANKAGYYEVKSLNASVDVDAERYSANMFFVTPSPVQTDDATGDFNLRFLIPPAECADDGSGQSAAEFNAWVFHFTASTDSACTFQVSFTWVEAYVEPTDKRVTPKPDESKLYDGEISFPAETHFTYIGIEDVNKLVYNETDHAYHYGTVDGPIVFVNLSHDTPEHGFDTNFIAGVQANAMGLAASTGIPDENNVVTTYEMKEFFLAYGDLATDGYYPLNEELKLALQWYARSQGVYDSYEWDRNADGLYLFLCGYFKSDYNDFTGGEGTETDGYLFSEYGRYRKELSANTPVWFATRMGGTITIETEGVTLKAQGDETEYDKDTPFTFAANASHTMFSLESTETVTVIFVFDPIPGSEQNPIEWKVGDNTVNIPEDKIWDGLFYKISVQTTGLYKFSTTYEGAYVANMQNIVDPIEGSGEFIMELGAGETYIFNCGILEGKEPQNYTVTIAAANYNTPTEGSGTEEAPYVLQDYGWYMTTTSSTSSTGYFTFAPKLEGRWELTFFNHGATIVVKKGEFDEGTAVNVAPDEWSYTYTIESDGRDIFYFYMGASNLDATITYFFYFAEASEVEPTPSLGDLIVGVNTIVIDNAEEGLMKTFVAPEAGTYVFSTESTNAIVMEDPEIGNLIDGELNQLSFEREMTAGESLTLLFFTADYAPGTYTLEIEKKGGSAPSGDGPAITGGNGSYDSPYILSDLEGNYSYHIDESDDPMWWPEHIYFKFTAAAEETYTLTTTIDNLYFYMNGWDADVINLDVIAKWDDSESQKSLTFTVKAGYTYTIEIGDSTDMGNVDLTFSIVKGSGSEQPGPGGDVGEQGNWEGSGTEEEPYIIENLEGVYNVEIVLVDGQWVDQVVFQFVATEDGDYTITAGSDLLSLYASGGTSTFDMKPLVSFTGEDGDNDAPKTFHITAGYTYKFRVCTADDSAGTVSFTITKSVAAQDETPSNALSLGENSIVIDGKTQGILYTFTAPEDGTYIFSVTTDNAYINAAPYNPYPWIAGTNFGKSFELTLVKGQTAELWCTTMDYYDETYILTIAKA